MKWYNTEEGNLSKVGIYLRLSQEGKIKKDTENNSIENQRRLFYRVVKLRKWNPFTWLFVWLFRFDWP